MSESSSSTQSSSSNSSTSRRRRNRSRSRSRNTSRSEPSSKRVRPSTSESRNRIDGDQDEFRRYLHKLDKKLDDLKTNIADSSRESLSRAEKQEKQLKNIKEGKDFKKRGVQKQYTFNQDIRNEIEEAITKVVSGRVTKAKRLLEGCVNRIKKRNKLLKIVDKSPAGWLIADEYETNDCASDSADDKKIRKAEKAALQRRNEAQHLYRTSRWRNLTNTITNIDGSTGSFRSPRMPICSMRQPFRTAQNTIQQSQCFACGGFGHWRANCRANLTFQRQSRIHVNPSMFSESRQPQPQLQRQQETGQ